MSGPIAFDDGEGFVAAGCAVVLAGVVVGAFAPGAVVDEGSSLEHAVTDAVPIAPAKANTKAKRCFQISIAKFLFLRDARRQSLEGVRSSQLSILTRDNTWQTRPAQVAAAATPVATCAPIAPCA
jgi:hypothetical protein